MTARQFDRFPARETLDQFAGERCLAGVRRQAADRNDGWAKLFHELTDDNRIRTSCARPAASS